MQIINTLIGSIVQVLLFSVIPFIWWFVTARKKESFFSWIGLKKPVIKGSAFKLTLIILAAAGVFILLMAIIMTWLLGETNTATTQFDNQGWRALPLVIIYAVIQTGLSEEIFFRGFLGKRLINRFGFGIGNTAQALFFGLIHGIPFSLVTGSMLVMILLTILTGAMGWLNGWMNEKRSSGSIVPSWITHSILNILSALATAL